MILSELKLFWHLFMVPFIPEVAEILSPHGKANRTCYSNLSRNKP
jgi:hypothetical protein